MPGFGGRSDLRGLTAAVLAALVAQSTLAQQSPAREPAGAITESYRAAAQRILDAALADDDAYRKLSELCDDIGHRLSGSPALDQAIAWAVATLRADGHENVRTQPVLVPRWVRGREACRMLAPLECDIPMLGLGGSIATPPGGITAEVLSVSGEDDLKRRAEAARGKIVLFDVPMPDDDEASGSGYGTAVRYRGDGARLAAEYGAVAALVRSVTTRSMQTPHTGAMHYGAAKVKVPAAAISVEFAEQITRYQRRGIPVRLTLTMEARSEPDVASANVLGELVGSERPSEVVVIGGHLDSWDVGQGAHDDGGGCVSAMQALTILRELGLRPRRTIRVVLFTNEENGLAGGRAYAAENAAALKDHVAAIESDSGMFAVTGYGVDLDEQAAAAAGAKRSVQRAVDQMRAICSLLAPLGTLKAAPGHSGADISPMRKAGVPLLGQHVDMTHYFDYHHTHADTLDKVDPRRLRENVAAMAVTAYILADMPDRLGE